VEECFEKKLSCCKAKHLSYGGRLVLINSVLSNLPMFMMSFFEIPKGVLKKLTIIYHASIGKEIQIRISIAYQNGTSSADKKIKEVQRLITLRFKINAF
jgi:hypothetical protein